MIILVELRGLCAVFRWVWFVVVFSVGLVCQVLPVLQLPIESNQLMVVYCLLNLVGSPFWARV